MNIASMILRILAILGAVAAAVMFWMIGNTKEQLESELEMTSNQLNETQSQLDNLNSKHAELTSQAEETAQDLEEARARASSLDNQLSQVRRELAEANKNLSDQEREAENLRTEAVRIRRELLEERNKVDELAGALESEDVAAARARIKRLEEQLAATEGQIQGTTNEGGTESQTSGREEAPAVVLRGEVVEVGENAAYVLIDIGSAEGARPNSSIMIRRGPRFIARANITEVNEDTSVAEILPGAGRIREGDLAVTLN